MSALRIPEAPNSIQKGIPLKLLLDKDAVECLAEFSIRPFLIKEQDRTITRLKKWLTDSDPHVRRLCTEGTRPRLPWAVRIPAFIKDPKPTLPILESLNNDSSLYVRRSVANHLGDIAKDHLHLVFEICESWLKGSTKELK